MLNKIRKPAYGTLGFYLYAFLVPALAIYAIFSIIPFLATFYYSFTNYTDLNPTDLSFVGLKNYIKVFQTPLMMTGIKNSIIYAIIMTGMQTVLGLPLAVLLNQKLRTRNALRAIFFFPAVFSPLIIGYLWSYLMSSSNYGLINNLITSLGMQPINFFSADNALYSVLFTQIWQWTGWGMVIFLANLQSIPYDLYEAAEIDGASALQKFFRVTLPLMAPSVKIVVITGLVGGLKVFDIIYSMTSGGPGDATQTVMTVMMKRGISEGFYSTGAAFGVVFFVIVMIISFIVNKLMKKWSDAIR
ncbi:carbohydrate ABC transporter permease [Enterococcus sp. LJL120]